MKEVDPCEIRDLKTLECELIKRIMDREKETKKKTDEEETFGGFSTSQGLNTAPVRRGGCLLV